MPRPRSSRPSPAPALSRASDDANGASSSPAARRSRRTAWALLAVVLFAASVWIWIETSLPVAAPESSITTRAAAASSIAEVEHAEPAVALEAPAEPSTSARRDANHEHDVVGTTRIATGTDAAELAFTVRLPDATPARAARVLAFSTRRSQPEKLQLPTAECDADGAFVLAMKTPGEYLVAIALPGMRPATVHWIAEAGMLETRPPLVLEVGAFVTGVVSRFTAPISEVTLTASIGAVGAPEVPLGWQTGCFVDGAFEWRRLRSTPDERGRYWFTGLAPTQYGICLDHWKGAVLPSFLWAVAKRGVEAPAEAVDYAVDAAALQIVFTEADGARADCTVELESEGVRNGALTVDGVVKLDVLAGRTYELHARSSKYEDFAATVAMPTGQPTIERRFVLTKRPPLPSVHFELHGLRIAQKGTASLTFFESGEHAKASFECEFRGTSVSVHRFTDIDYAVRGERVLDPSGTVTGFVVSGLRSGPYRVLAAFDLGDPSADGSGLLRMSCPIDVEIDVPRTGTIRIPLDLHMRGSLTVEAVDESDRRLPARMTIEDDRGNEIDGWMVGASTVAGERVLGTNGPTLVYPGSCAGDARLVFELAGYRSQRIPVHLAESAATPVRVTLTRER